MKTTKKELEAALKEAAKYINIDGCPLCPAREGCRLTSVSATVGACSGRIAKNFIKEVKRKLK